jgi:hypothetical protein
LGSKLISEAKYVQLLIEFVSPSISLLEYRGVDMSGFRYVMIESGFVEKQQKLSELFGFIKVPVVFNK